LLDTNIKPEFDALAAGKPATGETWIRDDADLQAYFAETPAPASVPATPVPAEGLVLLAHHDEFGVFFKNIDGRVGTPGLRHSFPRGSIAILAACVTAKPSSGMALLNRLNDKGVDAMIVSPFNVRLDYGSRMALEFAKVVRQHRADQHTPTLAEMFAEATTNTMTFFEQNPRLAEMALEFILVGNPYVRLCGP
jgi:hypothetical protein